MKRNHKYIVNRALKDVSAHMGLMLYAPDAFQRYWPTQLTLI